MPDLVNVAYAQTGHSKKTNDLGMREMQARAFEHRNAQFLLVKAPPASGKSRALMFIGLDKLINQGASKVIVAVPERSIGASFRSTALTRDGFFADWTVDPRWNLTDVGGSIGKVDAMARFLASPDQVLVCTHATLRFAYDRFGKAVFENVVVAIDEFHHASADVDNRLGEVVRGLMTNNNTHIVAMTGSYFRGDSDPVLRPEEEAQFTRVNYTYYEQLNGYDFLETLGIGYHFYRGRYLEAISEVLDPTQKTIIHIPNVQSGESTKDKYVEVDRILDLLGKVEGKDAQSGLYHVTTLAGRTLKIADLVDEEGRDKVMTSLRGVVDRDDLDIIIALNMAKEGFDWVWCEHVLTVGYRGSLTEVIQIIGRATRDAPAKSHAQFTNLIAEPDATEEKVTDAVNNMLKAIACSLLMEQVLAPNFKFKTRKDDDDLDGQRKSVEIKNDGSGETTVSIKGFREATSERARQILESDLDDLKAHILSEPSVIRAAMSPDEIVPEVVTQVLIPKVIAKRYPDLDADEIEQVRQHVVADAVFKQDASAPEVEEKGDNRFIRMANRFVNLADLHIDLIDSINPFQRAYEILSKTVSAQILERIHESIRATRIQMTREEAEILWPKIQELHARTGRMPSESSSDALERRMAEAVTWLRNEKTKRKMEQTGD